MPKMLKAIKLTDAANNSSMCSNNAVPTKHVQHCVSAETHYKSKYQRTMASAEKKERQRDDLSADTVVPLPGVLC